MSNVHDFWSGRTSVLPGLSPALPRHAAAGQCIPQRNRITGAYQAPAPVWGETLTTPLDVQVDALRRELESARLLAAELEHDVEFYRQQVDERDETIRQLQDALQQQLVEQPVATVGTLERFAHLEIRGQS